MSPTRTRKPKAAPAANPPPAPEAVAAKTLLPRRLPSQKRGHGTVEAVLRAAGAEIAQGGLSNLTTKRIAATAGLSVGAVYGYFPNKEAIVSALITRWHEQVFAAVDGIHPRNGEGLDLLTYLSRQVERAAEVYEEQPGLGALISMTSAMPAVGEVTARHDAAVRDSLRSALQFYLPRANPEDLEAATRAIPIMCHEVLMLGVNQSHAEREPLTKLLRVCTMAIATRLMTA